MTVCPELSIGSDAAPELLRDRVHLTREPEMHAQKIGKIIGNVGRLGG